MLLARSCSEELDVMGVEEDVMTEPVSSLTLTYEELSDVKVSAMAKLKLDWSVEREESTLRRLERFLARVPLQ